MGAYVVYKCPQCKTERAVTSVFTSLGIGYKIGRPFVSCKCGTLIDMRKTQNEWVYMSGMKKAAVFF